VITNRCCYWTDKGM